MVKINHVIYQLNNMEQRRSSKFQNRRLGNPQTYSISLRREISYQLEKEKAILVEQEEEIDSDDASSGDSDYVVPPSESNSSASDDEVLKLRKYAKELRESEKEDVDLRQEEHKSCNVPDEFTVTCNLEDSGGEGTPYFVSDDDLSYDEGSDGEVNKVRRKKTTHRVFDDNNEKPEFAVGMAFTHSREFKQALLKYGLANFHHLLFPKDERKRVSAKCSWPGCP